LVPPVSRFPWLARPRDAQGRYEEDPEYDPRTLFIPQQEFNKLTDFEKQYFEIKSKHVS
jgi:DNA mismatch repair protein MSH6